MAASTINLGKGHYTYADLEGLPEEERSHYELSYGALVVTPAPNVSHQQMLHRVQLFLEKIIASSQQVLPDTELLIAPDLLKRPDVQIVDQRLAVGQCVMGTPELVVEILSPATRMIDLTEKRSVYEQACVPAYWLIDPETFELTVLELEHSGASSYVQRHPDEEGTIEISVPVALLIDPSEVTGK